MSDDVETKRITYRDSIATGLWAERTRNRTSISGRMKRFTALHNVETASGDTKPPIQWVPGASSLGVRRQGHDADHSPPSSAELKNGGPIPPLRYMS
jgi:hypothetical protein